MIVDTDKCGKCGYGRLMGRGTRNWCPTCEPKPERWEETQAEWAAWWCEYRKKKAEAALQTSAT